MSKFEGERHPSASRRQFLLAGTAAMAATVQTIDGASAQQQAAPEWQGYKFLSDDEVTTLTALVDRLIPKDANGPGGVESGIVAFIDRELGGQFGAAARWYMQGPWNEGTPSQGWQFALTPAGHYRSALLALDRWCRGTHSRRFADLAAVDQDDVIRQLEAGKIDLDGVPSSSFFQLLWQNCLEGYLSDPLYGGNREMTAWKMIGFPGANPVLTAALDLKGEQYKIDPMAIGA
ncbi:MAG: gluconate 2-dehydrogenase gamma chain [Hyphomicrobiales bacterium]